VLLGWAVKDLTQHRFQDGATKTSGRWSASSSLGHSSTSILGDRMARADHHTHGLPQWSHVDWQA
jgi:hypothetical protein